MPLHLICHTNPKKHLCALQGFGFVEYCEISSAVAAKAAMDSAVLPAPEQQQTPPPLPGHQRHAQLFEMGFHPQVRRPVVIILHSIIVALRTKMNLLRAGC